MIFSPYTTSNENIAYPFLPSDSIAYKDVSMADTVAGCRMATSFLVSALTDIDAFSVQVISIWTESCRQWLRLRDSNQIEYTVDLPIIGVVPYRAWYSLPLSPAGHYLHILPGSGYVSYINALPRGESEQVVAFVDLYLEPSVIQPRTPTVLDFELPDHIVVSPETGVVKLQAGYNMDMALQSVEESLPGDSVVSNLEALETGISMAASAGSGEGMVPCSTEPVEPDGIVRKVQGATPDADGDISIRTDDCYRVEPDSTDLHGLILTGDCIACCECEDYYDAMIYLQKQFRYGGKLSAFGFAAEYNTEVKLIDGSTKPYDLFIEASSESDPTLKYRREGGYSLHFVLKTLHVVNSYHRWEYWKDGSPTPTYFSTATENDSLPLGVLWYTYPMGGAEGDVYLEDDPYSITCRLKKEKFIYPVSADNKNTLPAGFSVYITNILPIGLCKMRDAMSAMHSKNKESYQVSVQLWNALELSTTSVSSVNAWLTAGSYRLDSFGMEKSDLKGFRHAVLNVRMLALSKTATLAWIWSTQQDSTYTYSNIRNTYFYRNANFNIMSGPVAPRSPYALLSIVSRSPKSGKTPAKSDRWEMEYGILTYQIDAPSIEGSAIVVDGISMQMVSAFSIGLEGMTLRFAVSQSALHPRLDFSYIGGKQRWEYRFMSGPAEVVYHTQDFVAPISTTVEVDTGTATYYMVLPPWQVYYDVSSNPVSPNVDIRPVTVGKVYAEVGA